MGSNSAPLIRRITILNTYTQEQVKQALEIMETVWEDSQQYKDLSESAKDLLANALLTANDMIRK
jgi:hypothetical protein